jgi:7,8-didemethyl-8-hydroxy-5-deazariboflavin synthase
VVRLARSILPDTVAIQIPPNLVDRPALLLACLEAGATDLGGIGPQDEVNPDYPHPTAAHLRSQLQPHGWRLTPRLPLYPQYFDWLPNRLQSAIARWQPKCLSTGDRNLGVL